MEKVGKDSLKEHTTNFQNETMIQSHVFSLRIKFREIKFKSYSLNYFHVIFQVARYNAIIKGDRAQCGNTGNLLSRIFGKNFVKVTVLLKKLLNK